MVSRRVTITMKLDEIGQPPRELWWYGGKYLNCRSILGLRLDWLLQDSKVTLDPRLWTLEYVVRCLNMYARIWKYDCGHHNLFGQWAIDFINYQSSTSRCHRLLGYVGAPKAGCYTLSVIECLNWEGEYFAPQWWHKNRTHYSLILFLKMSGIAAVGLCGRIYVWQKSYYIIIE